MKTSNPKSFNFETKFYSRLIVFYKKFFLYKHNIIKYFIFKSFKINK